MTRHSMNKQLCIFILFSLFAMAPARAIISIDVYKKIKLPDTLVLHKKYVAASDLMQQKKYDVAIERFKEILSLSNSGNSYLFHKRALFRLGECYFFKNDLEQGKYYFDELSHIYRKEKDTVKLAGCRFSLGIYLMNLEPPGVESKYPRLIDIFKESLFLYKQLKNRQKEADVIKCLGDVYLNQGRLDLAKENLLEALDIYKKIEMPELFYTYDLLSVTTRLQGNFDKSLYYALAAVENIQQNYSAGDFSHFYNVVADNYRELGMSAKSIEWYYKIISNISNPDDYASFSYHRYLHYLINELIKENRLGEVKRLIDEFTQRKIILTPSSNALYLGSKAAYYESQNKFDLAEKYYLESIKLYETAQKDMYPTLIAEANLQLANFYKKKKNYPKAILYSEKAQTVAPGILSLSKLKDLYYLKYEIASETGKHSEALKEYKMFTAFKDSIFNLKKVAQIEELQIKYETAQVQNNNNQLKFKLKQEQVAIEKNNYITNLAVIITILLFIIVLLLLNRFYINRKNSKILRHQKDEISHKNEMLEEFIKEKDWMLKEIHHRVKNNLQIIMSLLNSQLPADEHSKEYEIIRKSQNRLFSISLIHQKLYSQQEVSMVNMSSYIQDLVLYLKDSFNMANSIEFSYDLDNVYLDNTTAIPIGLILNEAITNSIKYAFDEGAYGKIDLLLKQIKNNTFELIIQDNGKGLPKDFNENKIDSLGFQLIYGLANQIDGTVTVTGNKGLCIAIKFVYQK